MPLVKGDKPTKKYPPPPFFTSTATIYSLFHLLFIRLPVNFYVRNANKLQKK